MSSRARPGAAPAAASGDDAGRRADGAAGQDSAAAVPGADAPPGVGPAGLGIFEAYEAVRRARRWVAASTAPPMSRRARQWRQGLNRRGAAPGSAGYARGNPHNADNAGNSGGSSIRGGKGPGGTGRMPKAPASAPAPAAISTLPRTTDFTIQAVRDLSWLLRSPALLARGAFGDLLADPLSPRLFGPEPAIAMARLLQRLDLAPAPLSATQAHGRERRLGRYAERLFAAWLGEVPALKRVAMGLAVREAVPAGRTLGECDALFETPTGAFEHWELAVKFYLEIDHGPTGPVAPVPAPAAAQDIAQETGHARSDSGAVPDLRGCERYVGAGLADRFDWKLQRLLRHQLPLSAHPALQALAPGPWTPRMFVKGRLFYPLTRWQRVDCGADVPALATDHPRGWWATLSEWLMWSYRANCRWTSLERMDWLAPLRLKDPDADAGAGDAAAPLAETPAQAGSADAAPKDAAGPIDAPHARIYDAVAFARLLHAHFDSDLPSAAMPRQVAALMPAVPGQPAREMSRGFIVPDNWPARARLFSRLPSPG